MLRGDLEVAGIPYAVEGPDGPLYADFHALRHTYLTLLSRSGVDLRTASELAGHSTPELTAHYSHVRLHDVAGAVEKLPNFLPADGPEKESLRATGTDGRNILPVREDLVVPLVVPTPAGTCLDVSVPAGKREGDRAERKSSQVQPGATVDGSRRVVSAPAGSEAPPGFEPGLADLQSAALPLG